MFRGSTIRSGAIDGWSATSQFSEKGPPVRYPISFPVPGSQAFDEGENASGVLSPGTVNLFQDRLDAGDNSFLVLHEDHSEILLLDKERFFCLGKHRNPLFVVGGNLRPAFFQTDCWRRAGGEPVAAHIPPEKLDIYLDGTGLRWQFYAAVRGNWDNPGQSKGEKTSPTVASTNSRATLSELSLLLKNTTPIPDLGKLTV